MSSAAIRCPSCGASGGRSMGPDAYQCSYCGAQFTFVRPDVQKTDVITHNCPLCGKPVQAGRGYVCTSCKKFDLCEECVDKLDIGYTCKECLKRFGKGCVICGRLALHVCGSCKKRAERGQIKAEDVMQTCGSCSNDFFTNWHREERRGQPPLWGKVSFACPSCGEICYQCAEEKKGLLSSEYRCKGCGAKVNISWIDQ